MSNDNVNHPAHYQTSHGFEVIDIIEWYCDGLMGRAAKDAADVIKYTSRWKKKNGLEDLKKAKWYLNDLENTILRNPRKFILWTVNPDIFNMVAEVSEAVTEDCDDLERNQIYDIYIEFAKWRTDSNVSKFMNYISEMRHTLEILIAYEEGKELINVE